MTQPILISGGGACGLLMAHALHQQGIAVQVLEKRGFETVQQHDAADRRNIALTAGSMRYFAQLGLAETLLSHAQAIHDILVTDGTADTGASPHFLHFMRDDLPQGPAGYFIEQRFLLQTLRRALPEHLIAYDVCVETHTACATHAQVHLSDGRVLTTPLLVCCEGRDSPTVQRLNLRALKRDYQHTAIVTAVSHQKPHYGLAHEFFLPAGPFAILPMPNNQSSLVWVEHTQTAQHLLRLPPAEFFAQLQQRFGDMYGELALTAPVSSYPLRLQVLYKPYAERVLVMGDAAHVVHPVAGQGFNLGIADVQCVEQLLLQRHRLGLDVGSIDVLQQYARQRRVAIWAMVAATDAVTKIFSNDYTLLTHARRWGLSAIHAVPFVRKKLMQYAAGV